MKFAIYAAMGLIWGFLLVGCKDYDYHSTLYLEADGSAVWQFNVIEIDEEPSKRDTTPEEQLEALYAGDNPFAESLLEIGAHSVEITPLRTRPPFEYVVTGHFESTDEIWKALSEESEQEITWLELDETQGRELHFWVEDLVVEGESEPVVEREQRYWVKIVVVGGEVLDHRSESASETHYLLRPNHVEDWSGLSFRWDR